MSKMNNLKPVAVIVAAALVGSLSAMNLTAGENPFGASQLESGYMQLASSQGGDKGAMEGKCGEGKEKMEGKCGEGKEKMEGKCGEGKEKMEGKCGEGKEKMEGKCGEGKEKMEGKCGEGKCGGKS